MNCQTFSTGLDRVELGASRRQRQQGDVGRHDQFGRTVPSGLIKDDDSMGTGRHVEGDLTLVLQGVGPTTAEQDPQAAGQGEAA